MSNKIEEKKLRVFVRKYLTEAHAKKQIEQKQTLKEEKILRTAIQQLLQEKESVVPGASTGQNELESVLVSIVPALESDYKKLTTDPNQRKSYRAHIVRAAVDILLAADASYSANEAGKELEREEETELPEESGSEGVSPEGVPQSVKASLPPEALETLKEQEDKEALDIKIGDDEDEDKMIDIEPESEKTKEDKTKTKEEMTPESFTIPGQDLTGRNIALRTWNKRGIGTTIKNGYKLLDNSKDRKIFFDYLLTNLKLYFDKFEKELQAVVEEPTTPAYETAKQTAQNYGAGGQAPLAEGKKPRKRLVESKKLSDQILAHLLK